MGSRRRENNRKGGVMARVIDVRDSSQPLASPQIGSLLDVFMDNCLYRLGQWLDSWKYEDPAFILRKLGL